MQVLGAVLTQLLHVALMLAAAPLLLGCLRWLTARLLGRHGASPLQPYHDLDTLLRKRPVLAESASLISEWAPHVALGATIAAAALVPSFARGMALAPLADLILLAGLLAVARMALALAGMDLGTAIGGLGAARLMGVAVFAEPALLVCVLCLGVLAGTTNLDAIAATMRDGQLGLRVSLGLAALALLAVVVAEGGRLPIDHPTTLSEPAMLRQAMLLESSGRHLALWQAEAALRLTVLLCLVAAVFLPFGAARAGEGPLAWVVGLLAFAVKLGALGAALGAMEAVAARMRMVRVPEFLGAAVLLALVAVALLFVSTGPA